MNLADILLKAKTSFFEESDNYQIEISGTNVEDATVTSLLNSQPTVTKMTEWLTDANNKAVLRNALKVFVTQNKKTYAVDIYNKYCKNSSNEQSYQRYETDALNNTAFAAKGVTTKDAKIQAQNNAQTMTDMNEARFNDVITLIKNSQIPLLIEIALLVFGKAEKPIDIHKLTGTMQVNYDGTLPTK